VRGFVEFMVALLLAVVIAIPFIEVVQPWPALATFALAVAIGVVAGVVVLGVSNLVRRDED
jgi:hypothetical protein